MIEVLEKGGCVVDAIEVNSPAELQSVLDGVPEGTLVWANAYWVNDGSGGEVGLVEQIERMDLPMVGSSLETLNLLLEKDSCQRRLSGAGIPVPGFTVFQNGNLGDVRAKLAETGLPFPLVVKPTKESRSQGVTKVENLDEAMWAIHAIAEAYPHGNVIVEEFLPTHDITCGYIQLDDEIIILPSFNYVLGMDCSMEVFGEKHYKLPAENERQVIIEDRAILQQLEETLPKIVDLLGVVGVTRIDGRLDADGILKVFDINGMPGLNHPISALIKQCFSHFPTYEKDYVFECLINTIMIENFRRHGMIVPRAMQRHHLFNLESKTAIKLRANAPIQPMPVR
ncbi:MAG: hypothetical protein U0176_00455 [Bacteroidia bacterium]